jgi:hypothetical protein
MSEKIEEVLVDGQVVKIPTISEWGEIAGQPTFMDAPIRLLSKEGLASHLLAFVASHQFDFSLGLYRPGAMRSWMVLPLFRNNGVWQRVQVEQLTCKCCSSQLIIANPAEPSLYFGVPDELAVIRRASTLQQVACPQCGGRLERPAIWAEPLPRIKTNA